MGYLPQLISNLCALDLFLGGTGVLTGGFAHARQTLY
jgi:hypothetical protein